MEFRVFYHGSRDSDARHESESHGQGNFLGRGFSSGYVEPEICDLDSLLGLLRHEAIDEIIVFCSI